MGAQRQRRFGSGRRADKISSDEEVEKEEKNVREDITRCDDARALTNVVR